MIGLGATITGDKALDAKLRNLGDKTAKKAMRAGVNASLAKIASAVRAAVNAAPVPGPNATSLKAQARALIGKRFGKAKAGASRGDVQAKAGFGVGKKKQTKQELEAQKNARKSQKKKGVGIGVANIHWFVLGTAERTTGFKKAGGKKNRRVVRTGNPIRRTGRITPPFAGIVSAAVAASEATALEAARKKVQQVILKEAQRKG